MSFITTQLLINKLGVPTEICSIVKNYLFHEINKLSKNG